MAVQTTFEQETDGVIVRASPAYLPAESQPKASKFVWVYTIEIENKTAETIQLLSRLWKITDGNGVTHRVEGDGVVGEQPVLEPGEMFRYTSACPLSTPSGWMVGSYRMTRPQTGDVFEVAVPAFSLDSPQRPQYAN